MHRAQPQVNPTNETQSGVPEAKGRAPCAQPAYPIEQEEVLEDRRGHLRHGDVRLDHLVEFLAQIRQAQRITQGPGHNIPQPSWG